MTIISPNQLHKREAMKTHQYRHIHVPTYVPASDTEKLLYEIYKNTSQDKFVGQSSFYDLWKKLLPHIKISMPKDDACFKCESHRKAVEDARPENENSKLGGN